MFRTPVLYAIRRVGFTQAKQTLLSRSISTVINPSIKHLNQFNQYNKTQLQHVRFYSSAPELTKDIIRERIIELLESYNKVKPGTEISESSAFTKDLGLDSFDTVEVIMEIEYEFSIVIPDQDADDIKTVGQAIDYIAAQPGSC